MILQQVMLHNFEEVVPVPGSSAVMLERIPRSVALQLRETTQSEYKRAGCSEIRFVSEDSSPVDVTLSSPDGPCKAYLYFGDFPFGFVTLTSEPTVVRMEPKFPYLLTHQAIQPGALRYPRHVWRILLHDTRICFHGIEGKDVRPPFREELPQLRYLAYGTSITYGAHAYVPDVTYVMQAATNLGMDLLNLGAAGSAHCEPALADYFADRKDWDIASLCISVNMLNQGVSAAEFREKTTYMADAVAGRNPGKPVICIGLFPSFNDFGLAWPERNPVSTPQEYRETLRQVVNESGLSNLYYVDGTELLTQWNGLSHDLLHPNHQGMIEIGSRLAEQMRGILGK
ncbi:GDSL-type esterase/lipase family protein [Paenibacillus sp. LjRoot56]|uniref:GDSL-type esterase/lipase family protein n=1 Tax=Paenibacillus sp. LjRoot56 TaxID=3342333 RepID=UPI003ECC8CC3